MPVLQALKLGSRIFGSKAGLAQRAIAATASSQLHALGREKITRSSYDGRLMLHLVSYAS